MPTSTVLSWNGRVPVPCWCELRGCRDEEGQGPVLKKVTAWYFRVSALACEPSTQEAESGIVKEFKATLSHIVRYW